MLAFVDRLWGPLLVLGVMLFGSFGGLAEDGMSAIPEVDLQVELHEEDFDSNLTHLGAAANATDATNATGAEIAGDVSKVTVSKDAENETVGESAGGDLSSRSGDFDGVLGPSERMSLERVVDFEPAALEVAAARDEGNAQEEEQGGEDEESQPQGGPEPSSASSADFSVPVPVDPMGPGLLEEPSVMDLIQFISVVNEISPAIYIGLVYMDVEDPKDLFFARPPAEQIVEIQERPALVRHTDHGGPSVVTGGLGSSIDREAGTWGTDRSRGQEQEDIPRETDPGEEDRDAPFHPGGLEVETASQFHLGVLPVLMGVAALGFLAWRIEWILKALQLSGLRLFTRINKEAILKNGKRNKIFTIIQQNPGIHAREIADSFHLPRNTVSYHVDVLARHGKVLMFPEGNKVFIYPADFASSSGKLQELKTIPNPIDQQIVQFLEKSPDATQREIATALGVHSLIVCRRMAVLAEKGLCGARKGATTA